MLKVMNHSFRNLSLQHLGYQVRSLSHIMEWNFQRWKFKNGMLKIWGGTPKAVVHQRLMPYRRSAQSGSPVVGQGCGGGGSVMWGGKQKDVPRSSAGRGRAGRGDDDDLMIFTKINTAIVQERLKISQQILWGLTWYKTLRHIVLKQQGLLGLWVYFLSWWPSVHGNRLLFKLHAEELEKPCSDRFLRSAHWEAC